MTKAKKLVAAMLAFLMIFSSVSAISYAADETGIAGNALSIGTKFFKEVDGEWVETEKVRPGDVVEARVYLGTDYYSATSTLLFFYDSDFFTTAYGAGDNALEVNANNAIVSANDVYGYFAANEGVTAEEAGVSSDFLASHGSFLVRLQLPGAQNVKFDGSDWIFKFTLTVAEGASGEGDLFVEKSSIQTTDNSGAIVNVPKGEANSNPDDNWPMWLWDANVTLSSQPVSTVSSVTFNANGGEFAADDTAKFYVEGEIDSAITATMPTLTKAGYTFKGWIDANDETPTEAEVIAAPTTIPEKDLELNAYWVKNVNITFDTDGGTEIPAITDVTPGDAFATVADPTKDGYTFRGWDVAEGTLPAVYPTEDTEYKAIWALNVTVSFNTNGGTEIAPVGGYEGQAFEAVIPNPEKDGYRFVGWAEEGTYSIVSLPTVFPGEDVTYDAIYETKIYTAEFYVDGVLKSALRVPFGATVNAPFIPVEEGVTLDGWYTDVDCTVPYTGATMSGDGIKLYAKTIVEKYEVIFMNGDEEVARAEYAIGDIITAPADPSKAGYTFTGWTPDVGIMDATETKYFYATWAENEYSVTYALNYDGAGNYAVFENIAFGSEVEITDEPSREGYTFKGWGATADATTAAEIPEFMPAENLVYYAIWEVNEYTITFNTDGGSDVAPITEAYGTALTAPAAPTKKGYSFKGWAPEFPATMPAENLELTAQWEIQQFTITFTNTGDSEVPEIKQDYGTSIVAPADPEKYGYNFKAWNPSVPATMPAENMTIAATWDAKVIGVEFNANGGEFADGQETATVDNTFDEVIKYSTPSRSGYGFAGWSTDPDATEGVTDLGLLTTEEPATYYAVWTAGATEYSIEIYEMDLNGEYQLVDTKAGSGETDSTATYTAPEKNGFTPVEKVVSGTITAEPKLVLVVKYQRNKVALNYSVLGEVEDTFEVYYGTAAADMPVAADPDVEGYEFAGWTEAPATMPATETTINAIMNLESYTILLVNGVNGETIATIKQNYNTTINPVADPEFTGYEFKGWSDTIPATMPDLGENGKTKTITANFEKESYTIAFDSKGGSDVADITATYGETVKKPADPTKDGYTFTGWVDNIWNADGEYVVEDLGENGATKTLTATWAVENYTIAFDSNGGSDVASIPATYGETVKKPADPTREGYEFAGWLENIWDENGEYVVEDLGDADAVKTLVAQWTKETYTLKVVDNITGAVIYEKVYEYGAAIDEITAPGVAGYDFVGWSEEIPATMPDAGKTGDTMVITAVYSVNAYTITFDSQGGSEVKAISGNYGDPVVAPADPTKKGYNFIGWAAAADSTDKVELPATIPAGNVTYYAIWEAIDYTITWNYNGKVETSTYNYEDPITAFEVPADAMPGYYFAKWDKEVPATMPAEDLEFNAIFEVKVYKVAYVVNGAKVGEYSLTYGAVIPDSVVTYVVPEGETFDGWYTDEAMTVKFVAGATVTENVTLYAKTTVNTHTATFKLEGGNVNGSTEDIVKTYKYDEAIVAPVPVREGYVFNGWSPDVGLMEDEDMTFVAVWVAADGLSITYIDELNGKSYVYDDMTFGIELELPADPEFEGYTFIAWETEDGKTPADYATMPAESLVFTAKYEINTYDVNFADAEGNVLSTIPGVAHGTELTADELEIAAEDLPVIEGKTFEYWTVNGEKVEAGYAVKGEVTLVPYYSDNTYTVTFQDAEGNDADALPGLAHGYELTADDLAAAAEELPAVEGKTFAYWTLDGAKVAAGYKVTKDITLVPYYTGNTYNVTFQDAEGNELSTMPDVAHGYEFTADDLEIAAEDLPEIEGKTFKYWTVDGEKVEAGYAVKGDITLVPYYAGNTYNVTFQDAEGNELSTMPDVAHGYELTAEDLEIAAEDLPAVDGMEFKYWKLADGTKVEAGYAVTGETVLVPHYEAAAPTTVTVTYMQYEESEHGPYEEGILGYVDYTTQTYDVGATLTVAADPATAGTAHYTFDGWVDAEGNAYADGAVINSDITLYPTYTRHVVKLLPVEGSTTVIERDGVKESYNDNSVNLNTYEADSYDEWYIYGLAIGLDNANDVLDNYITVHGDGSYSVEYITGTYLGTGVEITVYDNLDPTTPVEKFYIVIFGDVTGNGYIDPTDRQLTSNQISLGGWTYQYLYKAADVTCNGYIDPTDAFLIGNSISGLVAIDQKTGLAG